MRYLLTLLLSLPLVAVAATFPPATVDMKLQRVSERVYYVQGASGIATDNQGFISSNYSPPCRCRCPRQGLSA